MILMSQVASTTCHNMMSRSRGIHAVANNAEIAMAAYLPL